MSTRQIWTGLRLGTLGPASASRTTDQDIAGLSGIQNGSERIRETLAALPGGKKLVVVLPEGDGPSIYFALMVAYLAWPREVQALQVDASTEARLVRPLNLETLAGVLFCQWTPPSFMPRGAQWAPGLVFVSSHASETTGTP